MSESKKNNQNKANDMMSDAPNHDSFVYAEETPIRHIQQQVGLRRDFKRIWFHIGFLGVIECELVGF